MPTAGQKRIEALRKGRPKSQGWADNDALRALDMRTRLDSPDGSLEAWQDAAGMHAQYSPPQPVITYDADAEQWTVAAQLFGLMKTDQAQFQGGDVFSAGNRGKDYCIQFGNYIFAKQESTFTVDFVIPAGLGTYIPDTTTRLIYWTSETTDISSDSVTILHESYHGHESGLNNVLWSVTFFPDGRWSSSFHQSPLQFAVPSHGQPTTVLRYTPRPATSNGLVSAENFVLPGIGVYELAQAVVPPSTDSLIVMAWHTTSALMFGVLSVLEDEYEDDLTGVVIALAKIVTDSAGKCTEWVDYTGCQQQLPGGINATVAVDSSTLHFNGGRLVKVTT